MTTATENLRLFRALNTVYCEQIVVSLIVSNPSRYRGNSSGRYEYGTAADFRAELFGRLLFSDVRRATAPPRRRAAGRSHAGVRTIITLWGFDYTVVITRLTPLICIQWTHKFIIINNADASCPVRYTSRLCEVKGSLIPLGIPRASKCSPEPARMYGVADCSGWLSLFHYFIGHYNVRPRKRLIFKITSF